MNRSAAALPYAVLTVDPHAPMLLCLSLNLVCAAVSGQNDRLPRQRSLCGMFTLQPTRTAKYSVLTAAPHALVLLPLSLNLFPAAVSRQKRQAASPVFTTPNNIIAFLLPDNPPPSLALVTPIAVTKRLLLTDSTDTEVRWL